MRRDARCQHLSAGKFMSLSEMSLSEKSRHRGPSYLQTSRVIIPSVCLSSVSRFSVSDSPFFLWSVPASALSSVSIGLCLSQPFSFYLLLSVSVPIYFYLSPSLSYRDRQKHTNHQLSERQHAVSHISAVARHARSQCQQKEQK